MIGRGLLAMRLEMRLFVAVALIGFLGFYARSEIVVQGYYRLGENDTGAANGVAGKNPTYGSGTGTNPASPVGGTLAQFTPSGSAQYAYSSSVAATAASATGSTLAMNFGGGNGFYYKNTNLTNNTDNWGIEGWFRVSNTATKQVLTYNGQSDPATAGSNGFGLMVENGNAKGIINGVGIDSGISVTANTWFYLAMVRNNGSNQLFVNNTTAINGGTSANTAATSWFTIGGSNNNPPNQAFMTGAADEVRLFTIGAGGFNANTDLLIAPAVPEPGTLLLGGIAAACGGGGLWWKRRKGIVVGGEQAAGETVV